MNYTKITILTEDIEHKEIWLGLLSTLEAIIGTEELQNEQLIAYTEDWSLVKEDIENWSQTTQTPIQLQEVPAQNWNASWESNFEPVFIPGFVSVIADFHEPIKDVQYEIRIMPKMSFGTGHHATTRLMMAQMKDIDFKGKSVFDYGTGTGILAILAEMLGATEIDAIDIDEWSYTNAIENIVKNDSKNIIVAQSDISFLNNKTSKYDIILANINRHILLESMSTMYTQLQSGGILLLSGILKLQDTHIIVEKANSVGFEMLLQTEENSWTAISFKKP